MEWEMYLIYGLLIVLSIIPVGACFLFFFLFFWHFILDQRQQESVLRWVEERNREMEMEE